MALRERRRVLLLAIVVSTAACSDSEPRRETSTTRPSTSTTAPPSTTSSTTSTTMALGPCDTPATPVGGPPGQSVFVDDANFATALAWAPDGRLFFAERSGAIRIAGPAGVATFTTVPTVTSERGGGYSERGLLGLALSPTFAADHFVYAFSSSTDYTTQVIQRFTECRGQALDPVTLVTLPSGGDCCHKGGRIAFGPDGHLYATLGDEHAVSRASVGSSGSIPQDPGDVRGKILRYRADGSLPDDNPFGPGVAAWATGFRNPYGLAFGDGRVLVTVNGPTGDLGTGVRGHDLAFEVVAGGAYQWPACYGYSHLTPGAATCLDRPEPDWSSEGDTLVPTGATWVDAAGPAPFAGHFVFCTFNTGMRVFAPGAPHATVTTGPAECRLDVTQGPDRALYFSDEQAIHRLAP